MGQVSHCDTPPCQISPTLSVAETLEQTRAGRPSASMGWVVRQTNRLRAVQIQQIKLHAVKLPKDTSYSVWLIWIVWSFLAEKVLHHWLLTGIFLSFTSGNTFFCLKTSVHQQFAWPQLSLSQNQPWVHRFGKVESWLPRYDHTVCLSVQPVG